MSKYRGYAALGLYSPKDSNNIGSVLRNAGCFEANLVVVEGKRFGNGRIARTDTRNTHRNIPTIFTDSLLNHIPYGAKVIGVELSKDADNLHNFVHPDQAYYLFGPEDGSLPPEILDVVDYKVYVPTNKCLNLGMCSGIILYDRQLKQHLRNE